MNKKIGNKKKTNGSRNIKRLAMKHEAGLFSFSVLDKNREEKLMSTTIVLNRDDNYDQLYEAISKELIDNFFWEGMDLNADIYEEEGEVCCDFFVRQETSFSDHEGSVVFIERLDLTYWYDPVYEWKLLDDEEKIVDQKLMNDFVCDVVLPDIIGRGVFEKIENLSKELYLEIDYQEEDLEQEEDEWEQEY